MILSPWISKAWQSVIETFVLVVYVEHSKAFRFYVTEPNDSVLINSIIESSDAIFDENRLSSVPKPSQRSLVKGIEDSGGSVVPEEVTEEEQWIRSLTNTPITLMLSCKPLGYKWIFKRKLKVDGIIKKFKASTIRLLIAMASIHNLIIHQMDVNITFLNGELEEEVYINQPQGFIMPGNENKDMREADGILSIRIKHESNVSTPMDISEKLMPSNGKVVSQLEYSRVIGCLIYVMTCTRPDIAFDVGKLSRLMYIGYPLVLEGYTDARWISNTEDNSFTSGWVFLLGGGAISWASKKQTCITGLTLESKFVALATASKEAEWLKNLLLEIPLWSKPIAPISIHFDSVATLTKAYSQMYNGKSRHLGVRHSMIRKLITNGVVFIEFVRSQQNLADHLTKGLVRDFVINSVKGWE
ncbi:zinc finger, CCHC-type containing protein [Tanacetum coccineum]